MIKMGKKIDIQCNKCNIKYIISQKTFRLNLRKNNGVYICKKCYLTSPEARQKVSIATKKLWRNDNYRQKQSLIRSKTQSDRSKQIWKNNRNIIISGMIKYANTNEAKERQSKITKKMWSNPLIAQKISNSMRERWQDENYRTKIAKAGQPRFSQIHKTFCAILTDLGIKFQNEFVLGPWSFDVMIPRENQKNLLIEINGDWVHSLPQKINSDKQKFTYYERYLSNTYDLKYIWEHEFYVSSRIKNLIQYWIGITETIKEFNFSDTIIKAISAQEAENLLNKYHYLSKLGRAGYYYGGHIDNNLSSVAVFAPVGRIESLNGILKPALELTRFCIHPFYQQKNYASYLISRFLKILHKDHSELRSIIAFSDTTFNHFGTIYKATNWKFLNTVKPDYWYADQNGWVMHKKTLWNRATNLKMTESEYAMKYNFSKVFGNEKQKFLFSLL